MKNPEREDGSPAERPSREVVMEGSFLTGGLKDNRKQVVVHSRFSRLVSVK